MARIAVVGGCGSGKSTIVARLQRLGHDAYVVGQEHSQIPTLWRRKDPEIVVYLDVTLETVRSRRGDHWPEWLYHQQQSRLENAREAADIDVSTTVRSIDETVSMIAKRLAERGFSPGPDG